MTFEEWFADKVMSEGYTTKTLAKAAYEAAWDQQQRVIDEMHLMFKDHVLVPVEPTEKMFKAGLGWRESDSELDGEYRMVYETYKAMIRAAQEEE